MDLQTFAAASLKEIPEEALRRCRLDYEAWGPPLALEGYLSREARLWRHPFSRQGLRLWLLVDGTQTLASCESYRVPVLLVNRSGPPLPGTAHGIASVFVEERLRGHGHAGTLLSLLHRRLTEEGALCTYLISEIGLSLYARLHYHPVPLRCRRFSAKGPAEQGPGLSDVEALFPADVAGLLEERYRLPLRSPLTLRTTPEQIDWHQERSRFYAQALSRTPLKWAGVRTRSGGGFCLWAPDYRHDLLRVLMLYPGPRIFAAGTLADPQDEDARDLRLLLHACRDEARRCGLQSVDLWENALSAGWLRGGVPHPGSDIPMIRPLVASVSAADWLDWERCHWL